MERIDNTKWQYNAEDDVYYQIGVVYCENPADESYENLAVFVPGAYLTAADNGNGTYTCELNESGSVNGDAAEYEPYLQAIGAVEGVGDAVRGSMDWCPITNLDTADEAYQWMMGSTRSGLSEEEQQISDALAAAFADYINSAGFTDENGKVLTLEESGDGIYQAGSYYEYLKSVIEESLNNFLSDTEFPYDAATNTATITSVEAFVQAFKHASKNLGAFDQLDAGQGENQLFGYDGGIAQSDTSVTTEMNLALALERYDGVEDVDFATVWGQQHVKAERTGDSTENFIQWVQQCTQDA